MAFSLSVTAHDPCGAARSVRFISALAVDAVLAARGSIRDASAHLEHDDVDVGRLVLRGRREAISVGNTTVALPGVGSYIARATSSAIAADRWAIATMLIVILLSDQLLFRPWSRGWIAVRVSRNRGASTAVWA